MLFETLKKNRHFTPEWAPALEASTNLYWVYLFSPWLSPQPEVNNWKLEMSQTGQTPRKPFTSCSKGKELSMSRRECCRIFPPGFSLFFFFFFFLKDDSIVYCKISTFSKLPVIYTTSCSFVLALKKLLFIGGIVT